MNLYQKKLEAFLLAYPPKSNKLRIKQIEYFTKGYMAAFEEGNESPISQHVVVSKPKIKENSNG